VRRGTATGADIRGPLSLRIALKEIRPHPHESNEASRSGNFPELAGIGLERRQFRMDGSIGDVASAMFTATAGLIVPFPVVRQAARLPARWGVHPPALRLGAGTGRNWRQGGDSDVAEKLTSLRHSNGRAVSSADRSCDSTSRSLPATDPIALGATTIATAPARQRQLEPPTARGLKIGVWR
jgi:hypothetical protein